MTQDVAKGEPGRVVVGSQAHGSVVKRPLVPGARWVAPTWGPSVHPGNSEPSPVPSMPLRPLSSPVQEAVCVWGGAPYLLCPLASKPHWPTVPASEHPHMRVLTPWPLISTCGPARRCPAPRRVVALGQVASLSLQVTKDTCVPDEGPGPPNTSCQQGREVGGAG